MDHLPILLSAIQTFFLVQSQDTCKEQLEEKEKGMDEKPAYSLEVLSKHTELVPTWAFSVADALLKYLAGILWRLWAVE